MALLFGKRIGVGGQSRKRDVPSGLWEKCPGCNEVIYAKELSENLQVCPICSHHFAFSRQDRIDQLADEGTFEEWDAKMESQDPLRFTGKDSYASKLRANQKKTGYKDAVTTGAAQLGGHPIGLSVMDFSFLGASMGSVVGEKITRQIERCTEEKRACIIACASGGARMYEGLFSLMQMAKTSGALARHAEAKLPYIPILTHPTMAGVMASFATLGDVIIAEPGALIGFAGPRVIKETTQSDLPEGFQRAEFLERHGLIDMVVPRKELKARIALTLDYMMSDDSQTGDSDSQSSDDVQSADDDQSVVQDEL